MIQGLHMCITDLFQNKYLAYFKSRVGFRIPKNRESRKILKFGNPESRKSHSRNFRESRIPKILIPKFKIPGQFFGLIPKILKTFLKLFLGYLGYVSIISFLFSCDFFFLHMQCNMNPRIQKIKKLFGKKT